jgi:hypothetical protein
MTSLHPGGWDSSLPDEFAGQRFQYEVSQLVPLALFIGIGVLFYALGTPTRRRQVDISLLDEQPITPAASASPPVG